LAKPDLRKCGCGAAERNFCTKGVGKDLSPVLIAQGEARARLGRAVDEGICSKEDIAEIIQGRYFIQ